MEISVYAIPGTDVPKIQSPDDFVKNLGLKSPVLIPKQKFQKMWPIFQKVCDLYGENPVIVYQNNKKRKRLYVEIRQVTLTLFKNALRKNDYEGLYPLRVLGNFFYLGHADVLHSIKTVTNLRETNKSFKIYTDILFSNYN